MIINRKIIGLAILCIFIFSSVTFAETKEDFMKKDIIDEQLDSLNIRELEYMLEDIINTSSEYYKDVKVKDILTSILEGKKIIDLKSFANLALKTIVNELLNNLALISQIVIVAVACSILSNLQNSFEKDSISQLANYVCYIVLSM
ncbi:MAG: stage III sporulation protein AE, partial [Tissierellales bacterium]